MTEDAIDVEQERCMFSEGDVYLPSWADKALNGKVELYAQLSTKDGRKFGNALVVRVYTEDQLPSFLRGNGSIYEVVTDFGHFLRLNDEELEEDFHPPQYRMKKLQAKLRLEYIRNYLNIERGVVNALR